MVEQPTLVLLHGLGANRHVWDGVAQIIEATGGTVYAPDIRGHGETAWRSPYTFGAMAADVAEALQRDLPHTPRVGRQRTMAADVTEALQRGFGRRHYVVVGHSMGGAVALALASGWFGPSPVGVATIGVKLRWSDDELARMPDLAARPPRLFDDRAGAVEWFMKLAGLHGVFDADDGRIETMIEAGVMRIDPPDQGWRAAQDPATVEVGAPDMAGLLTAAKCPVAMALGEHDPLVTPDHHTDLAAPAATNPHAADVTAPHVFTGLGHNAMVEDPQAVADWLIARLRQFTRQQ